MQLQTLAYAISGAFTLLAIILSGWLIWTHLFYGYVCFILSASQTWALYCLLLFFHGAHDELQPMRPWPKFLAIKAIIFFTYWQSILISMLVSVGVISAKWHIGCPDCWDAQKIASALNDFVICVEMLGFAIAHHYAFAIEDFLSPSGVSLPTSNVKAPLLANFMDAINVTDVSTDLKNSRHEILTKKQALAARFERFHVLSPSNNSVF
ncbi:hypothetical protein CCR75_006374 [Bremia lactucae]|uniref:Transmembrane protein n=1 Tax=Bremia lactucae TaxID=4779 RepID=A0A976FNK2_BRELC|nr:hypothetical protein CCR75_006374 [Bremia lactucae]